MDYLETDLLVDTYVPCYDLFTDAEFQAFGYTLADNDVRYETEENPDKVF